MTRATAIPVYSISFKAWYMKWKWKRDVKKKKKKTMNMELGFTALSRITRGKGRCVPMTYETELTLAHWFNQPHPFPDDSRMCVFVLCPAFPTQSYLVDYMFMKITVVSKGFTLIRLPFTDNCLTLMRTRQSQSLVKVLFFFFGQIPHNSSIIPYLRDQKSKRTNTNKIKFNKQVTQKHF